MKEHELWPRYRRVMDLVWRNPRNDHRPAVRRFLRKFALLNTAHLGSLSTIHANSAEQALTRFAHCVLTANVGLPHAATREAIALAIHLVAHIARDAGRRGVTQLVAVTGYEATTDTFRLETLHSQERERCPLAVLASPPAG